MAREKPCYRVILEGLLAAFPGQNILTRTDIMAYTGRGRTWLDSHGFKGRKNLTVQETAMILSNLI